MVDDQRVELRSAAAGSRRGAALNDRCVQRITLVEEDERGPPELREGRLLRRRVAREHGAVAQLRAVARGDERPCATTMRSEAGRGCW